MRILDGSAIDHLAHLVFSPDPPSRFQHEKVHGAKQGQAYDQALRALILAVLEDGIVWFQGYVFRPSRTNEKLFLEAEEKNGSTQTMTMFSPSTISARP